MKNLYLHACRKSSATVNNDTIDEDAHTNLPTHKHKKFIMSSARPN